MNRTWICRILLTTAPHDWLISPGLSGLDTTITDLLPSSSANIIDAAHAILGDSPSRTLLDELTSQWAEPRASLQSMEPWSIEWNSSSEEEDTCLTSAPESLAWPRTLEASSFQSGLPKATIPMPGAMVSA